MKRERLLYLDMIKFFAVICVFVCHFTRSLEYCGVTFSFKILPDALFSLYTGSVGVTLFFIASGASLMYVYENECPLKTYYKKRFMGIYPMFWITFVIAFCIQFFQYRGYDYTIPKYNMIFSVLGFDVLFFSAGIAKTFSIVGEWFLGVIIILYIVFPVLRKLVLKYPVAFLLLAFTGGGYIDYICSSAKIDLFFVTRIPEMVFGMVFVKYIKKVNIYMLILPIIALLSLTVFNLSFIGGMTKIYIVGVSLFLMLAYLFSETKGYLVQLISKFINKYSYPIFLTHHFLMHTFIKCFNGVFVETGGVILLFLSMCLITILASYLIDRITSFVLGIFRDSKL